jgi:hypothetical protein
MKIGEPTQPQGFVRFKDRQSLRAAFEEAGASLVRTLGFGVIAATAGLIRRLLMLRLMTMRLLGFARGHGGARRPMLRGPRRRQRRKGQQKSHNNREQRA